MTNHPHIPRFLGWAGVIPFLLAALLVWSETPEYFETGLHIIHIYGAIILSFLGGVHWGLELRTSHPSISFLSGYFFSILPSLIAFLALYLPPLMALVALACGFMGVLVWDRKLEKERTTPEWYLNLRYQLSGAVLLCLLSVFFAAVLKS